MIHAYEGASVVSSPMPHAWTRCIAGAFRFPADRAAGIAVSTTVSALETAPALDQVIFCCFSRDSATLHEQALAAFGSPCPD